MTPSTFLKNVLIDGNYVVVRDAEGDLYKGSNYTEALKMAEAVEEVAIDLYEPNGFNGFRHFKSAFFCENELFDEAYY